MMRPAVSPGRLLTAAVLLSATWAVFGALVVAILAYEPSGVALYVYAPGIVIALGVIVALVSSLKIQAVWRRGYEPSLPVPGWLWIAAAAASVTAIALSFIGPVSGTAAVFVWIGILGGTYSLAAMNLHDRLRNAANWPVWITIVTGGFIVTVVGIGAVVEGASLLTVVFFLALVLFGYHVWFVLPATLWQASRPETPEPDEWPEVDVLIPAYQEEGVVGGCIEAVLASSYPADRLTVTVIDDGSTDATAAEAMTYQDRGVRVLRRTNGGKHAALNLGMACSDSEVIVTVDADSRPTPATLRRMVAALVADDDLGALSAAVVPVNDTSFIGGMQRLEYAVSNTNRRAYSVFSAVPVVPGCFGVYRRSALEDVWGYDPDTVTEDFDVTIKLLRGGWAVRHGPAMVATIVPGGWGALWRQRLRWYRGGLETIRKHWDVLRTPKYGYVHALSLPARTVSQVFSPVASYVILTAVLLGLLSGPTPYLSGLLAVFLLLTVLIAGYSVALEGEPGWTVLFAPLLFVGYKHVIDASVAVGSLRAVLSETGEWHRDERELT